MIDHLPPDFEFVNMFQQSRIAILIVCLLTLSHFSKSGSLDHIFRRGEVLTHIKEDDYLPTNSHSRPLDRIVKTCIHPGMFALTFDDGPWIYEDVLSDYLTSHDIRGTFFVNGDNWDCIYNQSMVDKLKHSEQKTFGYVSQTAILKSMQPIDLNDLIVAFQQGHLIGSHTWSHPNITELDNAQFNEQLDFIETAMCKILGVLPRYFRAPYGAINPEKFEILKKRGYNVIDWTFDSGDAIDTPANESIKMYDKLAEKFPAPQIALMHENYNTTIYQVIPHAIKVLRHAGYKLVSITECLGYSNELEDFYQYVGKPEPRDDSWTCAKKPRFRK